jgi:glycosyltransferase involved in cell wall biosynthesis
MSKTRQNMVDLVIPVYNEARVLEDSLRRLLRALDEYRDFQWRIVIVNNGSTDDTAELAHRLADEHEAVQFIDIVQKGRGRALRTAWSQTDAEMSIYMDVDLSTDLAALPEVVAELRSGADVVVGSRTRSDSLITRCFKREFLSRAYNCLIRWVLRTRDFDDAQCGFKGIRVEAVRPLLPLVKNQDWFFDTELLVLAEYAGLTIRTLPITWVEDSDSRVNIPRTILQDLGGLARLRIQGRSTARRLQDMQHDS